MTDSPDSGSDLLAVADRLYALPMADFTPARDARAKELKGDGKDELSPQVKKLKKPSLAAWVVNLLVRREAGQVEQVLAVGEALREAQASMAGDDLRALTRQRRQLTAAVTQQARSLAGDHGVKVTQAVADQVEATLTAAMVDPACAQAVRSGLLVSALSSTGVDQGDPGAAVAVPEALGFTASRVVGGAPVGDEPAARPDLHVVPDPEADQKAIAEAQGALDEADEAVTGAQAAYDEAVADVEQLEARSLQIQAELDELKRRIVDLEASSDEAEEELGDAEDVRSEAEDSLAAAQRERDAAAAVLERLEDRSQR